MRPWPVSERSARSWPLVSGVLSVQPWMSLGTSSLLSPLSGSLLVTESSVKPAGPEWRSAAVTVAWIVAKAWLGGQRRLGVALQLTTGGTLSTKRVTVARLDSAGPSLTLKVKLS